MCSPARLLASKESDHEGTSAVAVAVCRVRSLKKPFRKRGDQESLDLTLCDCNEFVVLLLSFFPLFLKSDQHTHTAPASLRETSKRERRLCACSSRSHCSCCCCCRFFFFSLSFSHLSSLPLVAGLASSLSHACSNSSSAACFSLDRFTRSPAHPLSRSSRNPLRVPE